jgi:2-polyprenyl-3-methyl-5-hydroxy-6-metoxy-1,4-benzoquinol methylase
MSASVVIWHELECGRYRADLDLWRELAGAARGPVLEIGAGCGRVALKLARAGHEVTALDRDAQLLAALRQAAGGLAVQTVCAGVLASAALCAVHRGDADDPAAGWPRRAPGLPALRG